MQTLTLHPLAVRPRIVSVNNPRVFIQGRLRPDLQVKTLRNLPAPLFGSAELIFHRLLNDSLQPTDPPRPGQSVLIRPAPGEAGETFPGTIASVGQPGENLPEAGNIRVEHSLAVCLARTPFRRVGLADELRNASGGLSFNTSRNDRMGDTVIPFGTRRSRGFAVDGAPWTVGDALGYLLATGLPAGVACPELEELIDRAGHMELEACTAGSQTIAEMLADLAECAGLMIRAARAELGLVVYRPGREGRQTTLYVYSDKPHSAGVASVSSGRISSKPSADQPTIQVIGGRKQYESTFQLQPGWVCPTHTPSYGDVQADMTTQPALYRRWVLNEHGRYQHLDAFELGSLCDDFIEATARRFEPCLSIDSAGRRLDIVVEFRTDPAGSWERWQGNLSVATDECAVQFTDDSLPAEYFQAVTAGTAEVRVTASVVSDTPVELRLDGNPATWIRRDLSAHVGWGAVLPGSIFAESKPSPHVIRDDTALLRRAAETLRKGLRRGRTLDLTLPWCDLSLHTGDCLRALPGQADSLENLGRSGHVVEVRHDFGATQQTNLTVEVSG